jgi:hypothetical protein
MKTVVLFAAFTGGVLLLLFSLAYIVGIDPLSSVRWLSYVLFVATLWYSVRYYKRYERVGTKFSFGHGLKSGILFNLIATLFYAIPLIIAAIISGLPRVLEWGKKRLAEKAELQAESVSAAEEVLRTTLDQVTVYGLLMHDILFQLLLGALFSILAGVYFRD